MANGFDDTTQGLPDPRLAQALEDFAAGQAGRIELVAGFQHAPHYTDAVLLCIALTRPGGNGRSRSQKLFLKVLPPVAREPARHELARQSNADFAERHMVRQPFPRFPVGDGRHLMFQEMANGGDRVRTLHDLRGRHLVTAVDTITHALLFDWNRVEGNGVSTDTTTISEYVRRELAKSAGVQSVSWAARRLGLPDVATTWFPFDGKPRLNPLHLLDSESAPATHEMRYVAGYTHGDAHGGNLLVPCDPADQPRPKQFQLVDLDGFEDHAPLTRDLVDLVLDTVLRAVAPPVTAGRTGHGLPPDQADALRDHLINPDADRPESVPPAFAEVVEVAYRNGTSYVWKAGWGQEWRAQYLLSLVSRALVCLTFDNISDTGRQWCLRLAVEALEACRQELALSSPRLAPSAPLGSPAPAPRSAESARIDQRWFPDNSRQPRYQPWRELPTPREPTNFRLRPAIETRHDDSPRRREGFLRRFLVVATVGIGAATLHATAGDGLSDTSALPELTVTVTPTREEASAPTRHGGPRSPSPERRFENLAQEVAALREEPLAGRYSFTCYRTWARDTTGSDDVSRLEYRLWFTTRLSGLREITNLDAAGPARPRRFSYQAGDLAEVLPLPPDDPGELRDQLRERWESQPPELQDAVGMLRLVAELHRYHPLTPKQRAALFQELAKFPEIEYGEGYHDRAHRPGTAFQAENREGWRDTLLFGDDGRLLSHELLDAKGTVLSYHLYLRNTRTDTTDTRCR
ncbi:hypothetical protein QQG74_05840 [Micromonospora sp. FIMYZ51]|uniref:hypothetical protein n=1 Tax=Micromonospora sp. FIMYZ51 TaxID=3051832 RepID=UPI00311F0BA6